MDNPSPLKTFLLITHTCNSLEQRIENLHKEAKGYLDAVRQMTLAQQNIADTIDQFYEDSAPLSLAARYCCCHN